MALSKREFPVARQKIRKLLATPDKLDIETRIEAKQILSAVEVFSGARRGGLASSAEALELARRSALPRLVPKALLSDAEALAASGENARAMEAARSAQEQFARAGQRESEARAWLAAARAARASGNAAGSREYAARAAQSLIALQQSWSPEDRSTYNSRPDVSQWRKQIQQLADK